jgi:Fe2+ or Zn2+ uptake regulation protein
MNTDTIYKTIKSKGKRLTKARKAIIEILIQSPCLLSVSDILAKLKLRKIQPDRSTMYRELMFLAQNNIITKNTIAYKDYFELQTDHHHHLVCTNCNSIQKVVIGKHLQEQEKRLEKENEFLITNHSIEFYGLCRNCRQER